MKASRFCSFAPTIATVMIAISLCGPLGVVGAAQPPSALFLRAGDLSVLERIGQNTSETRDPLSGFRRYGFGGTAIPESSVLAFEENELFTMIVGDLDRSKSESGPRLKDDSSRVVRRLFLLKPSTILIDDETRRSTPGKRILWTLQTNGSVKFGNKQVHVSEGDNVYVLQSLRPQPVQVSRAERKAGTSQAGYTVDLAPEGMPSEARFVNVIRVRDSSEKDPLPPTDVSGSAMLRLTVRDNGRMFEFTLPRWREGAGEIRIVAADGKPLVDRRPLASGILPHSVAGVRQIARWNEIYRSPTPPSWDIGRPAIDLVRAVESGLIKPCRAVDLGCGSGTNAIYLAGKGFDVTGIDLSSTALSIAQKKAQQAGGRRSLALGRRVGAAEVGPFWANF